MLTFEPLDANKAAKLKPYLERTPFGACEYSCGTLFMWNENLKSRVAFYGDCAFMSVKHETGCEFLLPIGVSTRKGLEIFKESFPDCSDAITLICIPQNEIDNVKALFPDAELNFRRKWSDYVYNSSDIKELAGRKYGGQRNHINRFLKENPNHDLHRINDENLPRVIEFLHEFTNNDKRDKPESFVSEYKAALTLLENFTKLGLCGLMVTVGDKIISFAVGEVISDTLFVHVEKADMSYHGSYPFIVRSFAREFATEGVNFINREDDSDDPGLRTSKMSYHPVKLIDKYFCTIKL